MKFGTPTRSVRSSGNCRSASAEGCGSAIRSTANPASANAPNTSRQGPSPEVLRDLDVALLPAIADQLRVEVAAALAGHRPRERVVERDDRPAAGPQRGRERAQRHAPVLDVVQGERAGDAVQRPRLQGQRLGQVGDLEPAPAAATALRLLDHARADVEGDHVGALVEQPAGLGAGAAAGVEHGGAGQRSGDQRPQRGPLEHAVVRAVVGGGRPHGGQPVVCVTGVLIVLGLVRRGLRRHPSMLELPATNFLGSLRPAGCPRPGCGPWRCCRYYTLRYTLNGATRGGGT